jgi:hypothetical protein
MLRGRTAILLCAPCIMPSFGAAVAAEPVLARLQTLGPEIARG